MKTLSVNQMEQAQGGLSAACSDAIAETLDAITMGNLSGFITGIFGIIRNCIV